MHTPRNMLVAALTIAGIAAGLPTAASAKTFCVRTADCPVDPASPSPGQGNLSLKAALASAQANPGPDEVRLGTSPSFETGPYTYDSGADTANRLTLTGVGATHPVLTTNQPNQPVLDVRGQAEGTVTNVDVSMAGPPRVGGVRMLRGFFVGGVVKNATGGDPVDALSLGEGAVIRATVDTPSATGIGVSGGLVEVVDSRVRGNTGVIGVDADLVISGSRIDGRAQAVQVIGQHFAGGGLQVSRSQLTSAAGSGLAVQNTARVTLARTTIASTDPAPSGNDSAVLLVAGSADVAFTMEGSVLAGFKTALRRDATFPHTASLTLAQSEWEHSNDLLGSKVGGSLPDVSESQNSDRSPSLVDRIGGDLRLRNGDPAIDRDTFPGDAHLRDINGVAPIDGDGDGTQRSDAGALEFRPAAPAQPTRPPATPARPPAVPTPVPGPASPAADRIAPGLSRVSLSSRRVRSRRARRLALRLRLTEAATVRVAFSRKTTRRSVRLRRGLTLRLNAGGSKLRIARRLKRIGALRPGRYTVTVRATDRAGNRSAQRRLRLTVRR